MKRIIQSLLAFLLLPAAAFAQANTSISGTIEWDKREIQAQVSLDIASANIKLPSGRTQGEAIIASNYFRLIQPWILNVQVDSSATIAALIERGEWTLFDAENVAAQAKTVPPVLSPDFRALSAAYTLNLDAISAALVRHNRPAEPPQVLTPVSAPTYTGIIIIAAEELPVRGMKGSALPVPCLFPKIWDTEMNLVFERNMLNPQKSAMVRYAAAQAIFNPGPSGLSPEIAAIVGDKPLRIFARGVFGVNPTDLIIDRDDALLVISTEENRSLLREGKVAIILNDLALKKTLGRQE